MSNELVNILQSQLGNDQFIQQLSQQIGGAEPEKTKAAATGIVSTLMSAMAKNAATPKGANSLANALERGSKNTTIMTLSGLRSSTSSLKLPV